LTSMEPNEAVLPSDAQVFRGTHAGEVGLFERCSLRDGALHYISTAHTSHLQEHGTLIGGGASLFDRYGDAHTMRAQSEANGSTLTSRMRSNGIRLVCYLNTECDRSRSTIVHLPDAIDTLSEVFPVIQRKMQLDQRMLYAAELFLPDASKISNFHQLIVAASMDTTIIVGCGEPFDPTTVPLSIISFHKHGGGRGAAKIVKKELSDKKLRASQLKADQVRASGHGLSSAAASAAREATLEANRQSAAGMRHDYMNQLLERSSQKAELIRHVQANNARLRSERARRDVAKKSVWAQHRLRDLTESQRIDANAFRDKHEQEQLVTTKRMEHAKMVRLRAQTDGKAAKSEYAAARKAAGAERRMSYISRSVEKAAQESNIIRAHQRAKEWRRGAGASLGAPSSVQPPPSQAGTCVMPRTRSETA